MALFRMKPHYRKRSKTLSYYGTATNLTNMSVYLAATAVGDYALFAGGASGINNYRSVLNTVNAYDKSLVHSNLTSIDPARERLAATAVGDYALFAGGNPYSRNSNWRSSRNVDCYNTSLTKTTTYLSNERAYMASTTIGNYALFGNGRVEYRNNNSYGSSLSDFYDTFDSSLTRSNFTPFTITHINGAATAVGDYALFAGGASGTDTDIVDAYDKSLVHSNPARLKSDSRNNLAATTVGDFAIFAGGGNDYNHSKLTDVYNKSLTKYSSVSDLLYSRCYLAATTIGDYALFAGGLSFNNSNTGEAIAWIETYDKSLTRGIIDNLYAARAYLAATTIGDYALFAGGAIESPYNVYDTVDVYQVA